MIIYLYCNRPRKPQRGPCNVRGHRATALPQHTQEVDRGSQDGLMIPGKMDVCPPTDSMRRHQAKSLPCSHSFWSFTILMTGLNPPLHSPSALHGQTDRHTEILLMCRPSGQPPGCQAGQVPLQDQVLKKSSLGPGMKRP